jgi:hypothetical protein
MPPGGSALPDSLVPGNGADQGSRPSLTTAGYGGNNQSPSPTSPLDGGLPFGGLDPQYSRHGAASGFTNNAGAPAGDGGPQGADGRTGREQESGNTGSRDVSSAREHSTPRDRSGQRDRSRTNGRSHTKSPSSSHRICKKCGEPLTGQFVLALGGTFHLECFKCSVSIPPAYALESIITDKK